MSEKNHFQGNIPFKWENKPGVSKAARADHHRLPPPKLPPLPYPPAKDARLSSVEDMRIPLPPCRFGVPPLRSSSRKGMKNVNDDPFLIAYKEVTKGSKMDKVLTRSERSEDRGFGLVRNMGLFSCKSQSSCCVEENSLVRLSAGLPISKAYGHK